MIKQSLILTLILLSACTSVPSTSSASQQKHSQEIQSSPATSSFAAQTLKSINNKRWVHGAANCDKDSQDAIDIFEFNSNSYILRQNKCTHYEAPFIYVLFGQSKVLVLDTGAAEEGYELPIYDTVQKLMSQVGGKRELLVLHSHNHSDHRAGDGQFRGKAGVTLVEANEKGLQSFFKFNDWPHNSTNIDLGGRVLTVLPIPGHQDQSIAIYDEQTQWLLSGDTVYPGRLYVRDWEDFIQSISRLTTFAVKHPVSAVLGAHIEMSAKPGVDYPVETVYQPNEMGLAITIEQVVELERQLLKNAEDPKKIFMGAFTVTPISKFNQFMSKFFSIFN